MYKFDKKRENYVLRKLSNIGEMASKHSIISLRDLAPVKTTLPLTNMSRTMRGLTMR